MRILYPTDFSDASERAFELVEVIKGLLEVDLTLLHVVEDPLRSKVYGDFWDELLAESFEARRHQLIEYLNERLRALDAEAEVRVEFGKPLATILRHAKAADLVVMGTHGPEGLLERLLGSVTERVIEVSGKPVAVMRAEGTVRPFKRLLVASGLAEPSLRALSLARRLADASGARITLLHVVEPISEPPIPVHMPDPRDVLGHDYMEKLAKEVARIASAHGAEPAIREGEAAKTLLAFAEEIGADAVFIGRSREARFLGSVTREVLERAALPVFVHP